MNDRDKPTDAKPGDRGIDDVDFARTIEAMEKRADQQASGAGAMSKAADDNVAAEHAERDRLKALEDEARALEIENHKRLAQAALKDGAYGLGAYVFGRIVIQALRRVTS